MGSKGIFSLSFGSISIFQYPLLESSFEKDLRGTVTKRVDTFFHSVDLVRFTDVDGIETAMVEKNAQLIVLLRS